jgi:hypothetical protein
MPIRNIAPAYPPLAEVSARPPPAGVSVARRGVCRPLVARHALVNIYRYIYIYKAVLGRTVRTPMYVPVAGPICAHVQVMVAYRALGHVSPPALYFTYIAKSTTVSVQPRFNVTGHNI